MRLNQQQLKLQLRDGVGPLYLISSDEPLLIDEALDAIRAAARAAGSDRDVHVAERGFDWESWRAGLNNLSLFSTRELIELRLPTGKPGTVGARVLTELAAAPTADKTVVVIAPSLNGKAGRAKWVKALADGGAWLSLAPPKPTELTGWLAGRVRAAGLACEPEALQLLAARVEGNLLAAKQEIDKLVLLADDQKVTVDTVRAAVADGARFDVFQLADAALAGEASRAVTILSHLRAEAVAPPLILWSLVREVTQLAEVSARTEAGEAPGRAMTAAGVWRSREPLIGRALRRFSASGVRQLLSQAAIADRVVKGARAGLPWNTLTELTLSLAGTSLPAAETAA